MESRQPPVDLLGEDEQVRVLRLLLAALLIAGLLTGCGNSLKPAKVAPPASHKTTATPTATPTALPRTPQVGDCYQLDLTAATGPTSDVKPVSCQKKHTAVTVFVGKIDPIVDGHLLAIDAKQIQDQIASTCPTKVSESIGGAQDDRRLSRFTAIWFSPTLAESDAGADWFRCDVVAVAAKATLAKLPATVQGVLDSSSALDTFGTCGSSAPSNRRFERVICARPHTWRAVSVIGIPKDSRYLDPNMQTAGDDACKVQAQQRATDPLIYKWSFEWPSKAEWDAGRRYGLCWVPS
jgi:hypothetical protein